MRGQGSPNSIPPLLKRTFNERGKYFARGLACAVLLLLCLSSTTVVWGEELSTLRLRVAFGGGQAKIWHGEFSLSEGRFSRPVLLGIQADESGSMRISNQRIEIRQPSPRDYDGLDISVHAPLSATLTARLLDPRDADLNHTVHIPLRDLVAGVQPTAEDDANQLDETGNRLVIRRAPGDRLRILTETDSFVFSPGQVFRFHVSPHLLSVEERLNLKVAVKITSRLTGKEFFQQENEVRLDPSAAAPVLGPFEFEIPEADDCYLVTVEATQNGLFDTAIRSTQIANRQLQFVSIGAQSLFEEVAPAQPREVDSLDPTRPEWQERIVKLPLVRHLPRLRQGPLMHGESSTVNLNERRWMQLEPDAWQAFPLSVGDISRPHVVEVEYPTSRAQTLGISLLEPNAVGEVAPLGVDSAVEVNSQDLASGSPTAKHRLIFWPKTNTPVLLVKSLDSKRRVRFGQIRVLEHAGPLPAASPQRRTRPQRLVAAWYEKPLFNENFGAPDARDANTGRSLDDWRTFYRGGSRMVEVLRHAGYNSAIVSVWCDGSSIYPSDLLQPNPKFDTGVYLTGGDDPVRKDALEMLLRMFDREGMSFVPTLNFNAPLPKLEALRATGGDVRVGLEPVDHQGNLWRSVHLKRDGVGVYYNPLDLRVQQAMREVVLELVNRYGHHPSFAGVNIQVSPNNYAMLPGANWGLDDRTFGRFTAETNHDDPGANASGRQRFALRAAWCEGPGKNAWLTWRAAQMTRLYHSLGRDVAAVRNTSRLYLGGSRMLDHESFRRLLRPQVSQRKELALDLKRSLLEFGCDVEAISSIDEIALLMPNSPLPDQEPGSKLGWDLQATSELLDEAKYSGAVVYREPITGSVPSFDAQSPFGPQNTHTWLASQVSQSGAAARRALVESLARHDISTYAEGGWTLPLGQHSATRQQLSALSELPAGKFTTVSTDAPNQQPLIVRTLEYDKQTYLYVINRSSHTTAAELAVDVSWRTPVLGLGGREIPNLVQSATGAILPLELEPYDFVAVVLDADSVVVSLRKVTLPESTKSEAETRLAVLRQRAAGMDQPRQVTGPLNSDFEQELSEEGVIPGWQNHAVGQDLSVGLTKASYPEGKHALRLSSRRPVCWIRSEAFEPPTSGRIAVWMWLRTSSGNSQPPLRLAIEGRLEGESYYRFANVGSNVKGAKITETWAPFVLQINDLPRQGLTDLRVGFDLMGPGEVEIDNVQVFDLSFNSSELIALRKNLTTADFLLREEHTGAATMLLDDYWMNFLQEHVEQVQATAPQHAEDNLLREARRRARERLRSVPRPQSMFDRLKGWVPESPF